MAYMYVFVLPDHEDPVLTIKPTGSQAQAGGQCFDAKLPPDIERFLNELLLKKPADVQKLIDDIVARAYLLGLDHGSAVTRKVAATIKDFPKTNSLGPK